MCCCNVLGGHLGVDVRHDADPDIQCLEEEMDGMSTEGVSDTVTYVAKDSSPTFNHGYLRLIPSVTITQSSWMRSVLL